MNTSEIKKKCCELRADIVEMIVEAGSGHPGGSLSCVEILGCLYFGGIMNLDEEIAPRDRFILSKGHAGPALYAVLAHAGYFHRSELLSLRKYGSILQGHPDMRKCPGVEVSTGSLGQGLSISCGEALGFKMNGSGETVFTLLGDGECQEGQVWEAAMFAAHNNLDNLIAVIDYNELQIDGKVEEVMSVGDLRAKFEAFGWKVLNVDGHNVDELCEVLTESKNDKCGSPKCIIAKTVKGKGVSFMENQAGWHGKAPKGEEAKTALSEVREAI